MAGTLNWGILGTGAIAKAFASQVRRSRTGRLVAIGSREKAKGEAFAHEHGALLILDEVLTGFRVGPAGWWGLEAGAVVPDGRGWTPDLITFGKVIGGGMPLAALGGRAEILDLLAPAGPVYQAGTLSGNPVAVAAGLATLRLATPEVYAQVDAAAERLIRAACQRLIALEEPLNALDAKAGDGDTGSTVATGARSILERIDTLPLADKAATAAAIGDALGTSMGGSSGVLLSIFFTAAAQTLGFGATLPKALLAGLDRMTSFLETKTVWHPIGI